MNESLFAHLECADRTDIGKRRSRNEDARLVVPEQGVFCVADGMGGAAAGDVASRATVQAVQGALAEAGAPDAGRRAEQTAERIRDALDRASRWIHDRALASRRGPSGSTVAVLVFDASQPERAIALHAGDSRIYRFRDGFLKQVTIDHSFATEAGYAAEEDVPRIFRGVVTRAVGVGESVTVETTETDVREGDLFLVCTDGLTRMLPDRALTRILRGLADLPVADLAEHLVETANAAGGLDNITVVLVRVGALPIGD